MPSRLALRANLANRTSRRDPSRERAKATNPAPIPTTVVVGIVTPDSTWWVAEEAGEGEVVVGDGVDVEDMTSWWSDLASSYFESIVSIVVEGTVANC
jgi:hypothetical protein